MSTVAAPVAPAVTCPVTDADVLERAADLLEEFGWCQGSYGMDGEEPIWDAEDIFCADRFCVAGAIIRAGAELMGQKPRDGAASDDWLNGPYEAVAATFGVSYEDCGVADWNDELGRTKAEAVAGLRDAARRARPPD